MAKEQNTTSSGIGLSGAVFIVFLVLKLTKVIDWSWWWVTAPLWMPIAVAIIGFAIWVAFEIRRSKKRKSKLQQRLNQFNQEREQLLQERKNRKG